SGTPTDSAVGVHSGIEISVSDGKDTAALPAFSVEVLAKPNTAPVISGSPAGSVTAGTAYSFRPNASDADGDMLGFSISNKPAWATFSTSTGALTGTPPESAAGIYGSITISVSDGKETASLPAFSIEVLAPENGAPVISGAPNRSVTAGQAYSFRPNASDPDGDTLTFSISGKPSWANFSTTTGQLSGTPGDADVGTYSNILITVSDGKASTSLSAFSITVEQVSMNSVTLSWQPPTQNSDGTPLTDLAGFKICYGTDSANLNQSVELMNPGLTSAMIENLASGTWYFAVQAKNSAGVFSDLSNIASKTFP
ncbi:MAG TPA: putative Ig domain-containing protein, partial [Steroidobacteraceae bacterium]|nr:putative Ig domain-containing protein [Steroidobacteraceae bacterium]